MKVKALKSFSGAISMYAGEVRDIQTQAILDDLIEAGYIAVSYTHLFARYAFGIYMERIGSITMRIYQFITLYQ